jgi:signal peptide peptidase SppA
VAQQENRNRGAALSHRAIWSIREEALDVLGALRDGLITREEAAEHLKARPEAAVQNRTARGGGGGALAIIPVQGMIQPRAGGLLSLLLGGTSLVRFSEQFRDALSDGDVAKILLVFDSPGGFVDLVPETAALIRSARGTKPIEAVASTEACSAAYWLASQADKLAVTPSGTVGSIGVFIRHEEDSRWADDIGLTRTIIRAGRYKAEANSAEPLSDSAREHLEQRVTTLHDLFITEVAAGRGAKPDAVRNGYGEGRALLAAEALEEGMVDSVESFDQVAARMLGAGGGGGSASALAREQAPPAQVEESPAPVAETPEEPAKVLSEEDKQALADVYFE